MAGTSANSGAMRVHVEGLDELRRTLRGFDPKLTKEMQRVNKEIAQAVTDTARAEYAKMYRRISGKHIAAIRALATQTRARVQLAESARGAGGLFGQEFGSHGGERKRQFPGYAPSPEGRGGAGHFFYPSVRREVPNLADGYLEALEGALGRGVFG